MGARIENPLQTPGYPATGVAFQFDPGLYCIQNSVIGSYVELPGAGNANIKVPNTGSGWLSPNELIGGVYSKTAACAFELPNSKYFFTMNAMQLPYIQQTWDDSRGLVLKIRSLVGDQTVTWDNGTSTWKTLSHVLHQAAASSTGTFTVGAITWNNTPAVGQPVGWVCTVAGAPGTWVPMANL